MSGHTPGPWTRVAVGEGNVVVPSGRPGEIAFVQDDANARLIAAAPDLLAALEAMLKAVEGVPVGPEKQARDAIAKARVQR